MICRDCPSASVYLPQYGFSMDIEFERLVKDNHFLFRVYTPKALSPFTGDTEPFFVAPKFDERYTRSPEDIVRVPYGCHDSLRHVGTYEDVATHMNFLTKSSSPYVSASFSFIWSIWEALRRYHLGVKKDIEIAVIDASAVSGRAATAVQLLQASSSSDRRVEHWKWYRYAQESQSVLIYEYIPTSAVLASIPLISLLEKLPSYFLRYDISQSENGPGLAGLAWDYTGKKRNFHKFCQEMSNRFLQSSEDVRIEDTTAGSVRLAMAFLRPWFHRCVVDDFQTATVTLCALSFNIAQWPGQWWAQEHSELWNLIRAMVLSLSEEVRKVEGVHHSNEVVRLEGVIVELKDAVERYKQEIGTRNTRKPTPLLTPLLIPPPLYYKPGETPITPPTSPIRSSFRPPFLLDLDYSLAIGPENAFQSDRKFLDESLLVPTAMTRLISAPPESPYNEITFFVEPPSSRELQSSPPSPVLAHDQDTRVLADAVTEDKDDSVRDTGMIRTLQVQSDVLRKPPTMVETASCLVTGFLIGAFITLCLMSPQRRTLLTHLT